MPPPPQGRSREVRRRRSRRRPACPMSPISRATRRTRTRPITFLYNGGPGSSTVWLHMGAFGPRRVVTPDDKHAPAAPYRVVDNEYSLLDASDLVFIDAPGTGFGRICGPGQGKGLLGRRPGRPRLRQFHRRVPVPARPLEFARNTCSAKAMAPPAPRCWPTCWKAKALDLNGVILLSPDPELRRSASTGRNSIPASTCRTCSRCRLTRPPPGITRSCRQCRPPRSSRSCARSSISR